MENIVRKRMTVCGVSALCALALAGGVCLIAPPAAAQAETHDHSGWEELTSAGGEMGGGTYYLTDDVELQSDLTVTGEATLCLNGHILKGTGQNNVISVQDGADFTLCDCNGSQSTHYYTVDEDGLYIFDGVTADTPEAQPLEGDRVTQDKLEAAVEAAQAALEEQIEAVQAELDTAVGQLQASIASGEADAAALEEGLAALEEALRAAETLLGGDISALEEQLGALEEAYAAADDAVMDAVEALRADNAAMTTALWLVGAAAVVALAAGAAALVVALTARKRS